MPRSSLLAATLIAFGLLGAGGAEARPSATPSHAVSTQARSQQAPGRATSREAARRPDTRRGNPAPESRPCRSGATVSMFYSTERGRTVRRASWNTQPALPLGVLGPACTMRETVTWT